MSRSLLHYRKNIYSQNGEDGVIDEILRRLAIESGWCCEFGAWDGRYLSNTFHLVEAGWKAVLIESDPERYADLQKTAENYPAQMHAIQAVVAPEGSNSLDRILSHTRIPPDFEVLSIDVDGSDLLIWHGLKDYRPKIVVIEINSSILPFKTHVQGEAGASTGSSFRSMLDLGRQKGYSLVAHTGNMIFVENALAGEVGLGRLERALPYLLFDPSWLERDMPGQLLRLSLALWCRASDLGRESFPPSKRPTV